MALEIVVAGIGAVMWQVPVEILRGSLLISQSKLP
jgi:hypothetical protein